MRQSKNPKSKGGKEFPPIAVNVRKSHAKKQAKMMQPRLPKTADEISSNWKALSVVIANDKKQRKQNIKRQKTEESFSKFKQRKSKTIHKENSSKKNESNEIWFDDVDPDDIEKARRKGFQPAIISKEKLSFDCCRHTQSQSADSQYNSTEENPRSTKYVAMDCEFVGIGREGEEHMLARVSIVNSFGDVLYDQFVAPQERVIDYRTVVSGVRPADLRNAPNFAEVQKDVAIIIKSKTLVGHSIATDLKVLLLDHPRKHIRDTAKYKPFQKRLRTKYPSLKRLAKEILSVSIQDGEHSSVEDARAAMQLYREHRKEWEKSIKEKFLKNRTKPKSKSS